MPHAELNVSSQGISSKSNTQHLWALTGIRGIAAWFVVLFHIRFSWQALLPEWAGTLLEKGYLAVDLFFMLSGFVIWYNYGPRLRGCGWVGLRDFLVRRLIRIWPLHGVMLFGFILFIVMITKGEDHPEGYSFAELPLHFLLMQNWGFTQTLSWNYPAWSISTEWGAYIVFALLLAFRGGAPIGGRLRPMWQYLGFWSALVAVLAGIFHSAGVKELGDKIPQLGLVRCILEFAVGVVVCLVWQRLRHNGHWMARFWLVLGVMVGVAGYSLEIPEIAFMPLALSIFLLGLALDKGWIAQLFSTRMMLFLGEISYSTYLSHALLFIIFKFWLMSNDGQLNLFTIYNFGVVFSGGQLSILGLCAYILIVLFSSVVLFYGVERFFKRYLMDRITS